MPQAPASRTSSARRSLPRFVITLALAGVWCVAAVRGEMPKVPEGFKIRLVAAVPAVSYPCQLATAPDGSLFVGEDPMDQIGPANKPIDRILLFRPGHDEPTVFAEGLNAIFGMLWRDGSLYVMNMPNLTVLRDTNGDGKADERREIFTDMGVGPGVPNMLNDHIVSGIQIGMDGHLYISVGDKGVPKATGPDGRTVQLKGGGVIRCRPDGTELEVYSSGTRNHLEPNLDARDQLFTYDNTDDGLGWWTRVVHHIDGGYFGYPYDYHDRKDKILPHMAEYGGGSPCGGVVYEEDAWPEDFRGRAFWAEWGKRAVRAFRFKPKGATFEVADVVDFVQPGDVENFRPIDLALSHDGQTMYVADWSMGGWGEKKEQLGRVYAVTYAGEPIARKPRGADSDDAPTLIAALDHPARTERIRAQRELIRRGDAAYDVTTTALANPQTPETARRHLVWTVAGIAARSPKGAEPLTKALKDPSADVRSQAARALGLEFGPFATDALIAALADAEPAVRLQSMIALGRIADPSGVAALIPAVADPDVYLAFSARKAMARIGDWDKVAAGLASTDPKVRAGILLTLEGAYSKEAVKVLTAFAGGGGEPAERARAVVRLASVAREAPPWDGKWWGTQPAKGKPPAKTVDWEGTPMVLEALRGRLEDPASAVRIAAAGAVAEVDDQASKSLVRARFAAETDAEARAAFAGALGGLRDREALPALAASVRDSKGPAVVRDAALQAVEAIGGREATDVLLAVLDDPSLNDDRRKSVVAALGRFQADAAVAALVKTLENPAASVREAAVGALGSVLAARRNGRSDSALKALRAKIDDADLSVRKKTVEALGTLEDSATLIAAARRDELRTEATEALAEAPVKEAMPVFIEALAVKNPTLRKKAAEALAQLKNESVPQLDQLAGRRELPAGAVPDLRTAFGLLEPIRTWKLIGPFEKAAQPPFPLTGTVETQGEMEGFDGKKVRWRETDARDRRGRINLARLYGSGDKQAVFGVAEVQSPSDRVATFSVGSDDTLAVWVNGEKAYDFDKSRGFRPEADHFDAPLRQGVNRVVVRCGNNSGPWDFSVAISGALDYAFLKAPTTVAFDPEAYRARAAKGGGDVNHGKALFHDLKGPACVKCHAVAPGGATVGPELSSVGAKYPRDEIITSVLLPSAKISSGFEPVVLALEDGRVVTGVLKSETPEALEIQDADAKTIRIPADKIEDRKRGDVSIMPPGLVEGISPGDFADLIAYLESLKEVKPATAPK
ncbi:PVC-type heme-binding CxxCH protein [Paludisphaera rhizosphaerae]|uniref:PVC-type heme-binding CxxCH protein n=1 Tax=Paludisphaera rhizosphaerae TaxID=2711216 RepID=UPI0013EA8C4C|nr:PVC-type heme-binding CxxCH protein [Paludisphaera rhizosphaerae]